MVRLLVGTLMYRISPQILFACSMGLVMMVIGTCDACNKNKLCVLSPFVNSVVLKSFKELSHY